MLKGFLFFVLVSFSLFARAQGGDVVNNGGGYAEAHLQYAATRLESLLDRAATHRLFATEPWASSRATLALIVRSEHPTDLVVRNDEADGSFFWGRAFRLEASPVHRVFVNRAALYPLDATGQARPLDLGQSYAFLARVWSARDPQSDANLWMEFAARLERYASLRTEILRYGALQSSVVPLVSSVADPVSGELAGLLVTDSARVHDFASEAQAHLFCSDGTRPESWSWTGLHWSTHPRLWSAEGRVGLKCGGLWQDGGYLGLHLPMQAGATAGEYLLDRAHVEIDVSPATDPR